MTPSFEISKVSSRNISKHLIGICIAGSPFIFCGLISLMNPNYIKVFVSSDKGTQPLGWILTAVIFLLTIMIYLGVGIAIDSLSNKQKKSILWSGVSIVGVIISVLVVIILIFLGPALLLFLAGNT